MTKLLSAIAAVQSEGVTVSKNRKNTALNSTYANLSDVITAILPVMYSNGLSFIQMPGAIRTEGKVLAVSLCTQIIHAESGEKIEFTTEIPLGDLPTTRDGRATINWAQAYGLTLTYAKRYALLSALGISTGDDRDAQQLTEKMSAVTGSEEDWTPAPHWTDFAKGLWKSQPSPSGDGLLGDMTIEARRMILAAHVNNYPACQACVADGIANLLLQHGTTYEDLPKPAGTWPDNWAELTGSQLWTLARHAKETLTPKQEI